MQLILNQGYLVLITNNMVNPQKPVIPELNTHRNLEFFDRQAVLMPEPLVVEKDQRPLPKP